MAQGILPFQFKIEDAGKSLTAMAGLLVYLDLLLALKVRESVRSHVSINRSTPGGPSTR